MGPRESGMIIGVTCNNQHPISVDMVSSIAHVACGGGVTLGKRKKKERKGCKMVNNDV